MKKVVIIVRVLHHYRASFFEKINDKKDIDLSVFYSPDLIKTKFISSKKHYNFKKHILKSFKIKFQTKNGIGYLPISPFLLFKLISLKPDVVVIDGVANLFNSMTAFLYAKIFRKKIVWWSLGSVASNHDIKESLLRRIFNPLIHILEKNMDSIIAYSSKAEDYFINLGIDNKKIFKAVNVVDTNKVINNLYIQNKIRAEKYISQSSFKIIFVGTLASNKNIDILLKSFSKIEKIDKKIELIIVGDGPHRSHLEELARSLSLENVFFAGKRIEDSHFFWRSADLFIQPGLGGLAISEAMCYSLPVLCSFGDGTELDLVTKRNGIIEKKITKDNLIKHILYFKRSNEINSMGKESRRLIEDKFNINNMIKAFMNAL